MFNYFVVILLVSLCHFGDGLSGPEAAYALTTEDERILGEKFLAEVRKSLPIINDDFLNTTINELGQYLTRSLELKPFQFHFYPVRVNE